MVLKKIILREEDPETGKTLKTETRYDGRWKGVLEGDAVVLIKFGDEEMLNTTIKVPSKKQLHFRVTLSSVLADAPKK